MVSLRYQYQTLEFGDSDIHIRTLRDRQEFEDSDGIAERIGISSANWSLFGVLWDSGHVLAHVMHTHDIEGKRILEVGCGIGLSSLVLNQRHANIHATDYHPEAAAFLVCNTRLNDAPMIPFVRTGWADHDSGMGKFDIIIGSDILYEHGHVQLLADFIEQQARPNCEVIVVDPGRGHHARFSKKMVLNGYTHSQSKPENVDYLVKPFRGQILRYFR